jgi:hypothetical protein
VQNVGYTYAGGTFNISDGTITYGQLQALTRKFAHLVYVEMNGASGNGDAQTANALSDALTGFYKYLPLAAYNNSQYRHVLNEPVSSARLHRWDQNYLVPVLDDCANGGG